MKKTKSLSYLLTPDAMFEKFDDITPEFLLSKNITALLIDIDNTLAPYEQAEPDENIVAWVNSLRENGIGLALISNNHADRVELFNSELKYFATWDSGKPFIKCHKRAMAELGTDRDSTAVIGDQIFTDVWSGKRLGLYAILVKPIKDKTSLFNRSKRALEKPILRRYMRLHSGDGK